MNSTDGVHRRVTSVENRRKNCEGTYDMVLYITSVLSIIARRKSLESGDMRMTEEPRVSWVFKEISFLGFLATTVLSSGKGS